MYKITNYLYSKQETESLIPAQTGNRTIKMYTSTINWRLMSSEIFHWALVSIISKINENDPNLIKFKSPQSDTHGYYCFLPFPHGNIWWQRNVFFFWLWATFFLRHPVISWLLSEYLIRKQGSYYFCHHFLCRNWE